MVNEADVRLFADKCKAIFEQVGRDIIGQEDIVELTVIAMIAGGNVLLEGVPGIGKTRLIRSLGRVFSLPFSRIQFTPDLMPADITGTNVLEKDEKGNAVYTFRPGPIFSHIVLADEINRATPKTQAALLEAMQEHSVTVAGETHALSEPYFVLATQNPVEQEGTYPLPEAQLDRFLFKVLVRFPTLDELSGIVDMTVGGGERRAEKVSDGEKLLRMRAVAREVPVAKAVKEYALKLLLNTHPEIPESPEITRKYLRFGASPRAAQALIAAARVHALMEGRYNVSFDDIDFVAPACLRHRIALSFEGLSEGMTADGILRELMKITK